MGQAGLPAWHYTAVAGFAPEGAGSDSSIRHHRQAVEAAQIVLDQTEREEIRRLAEDIVSAQTREIEQLREWRAAWY